MATQTKRPRGRETRQALIQAGVEEINRHGVTEFSVRRIAQICGVSCGAPYKPVSYTHLTLPTRWSV